jgi:hypothetical protein
MLELERESEDCFLLRKYRENLPEYAERRFPEIFSFVTDKRS